VFIASPQHPCNRKITPFPGASSTPALDDTPSRTLPRDSTAYTMSEHTYKLIELVGSSPRGIEAAVENAILRAGKTLRNLRWFEVIETRGHIENGAVAHWQVTIKAGFTLED
jgi:flavin-binding protein dodecin